MELSNGFVVSKIKNMSPLLTSKQKELWTDWIVALRSGKYVQGRRKLRAMFITPAEPKERMCCLGVACDLAQDLSKDWKWEDPLPSYHNGKLEKVWCFKAGTISEGGLPSEMEKMYGFVREYNTRDHFVETLDSRSLSIGMSLTGINDSGATFEDIAMILEHALNGGYVQGNTASA